MKQTRVNKGLLENVRRMLGLRSNPYRSSAKQDATDIYEFLRRQHPDVHAALLGRINEDKCRSLQLSQHQGSPREVGGLIAKLSNGNFLFSDVLYQGSVLPAVELSSCLLDNGASKSQDEWLAFSRKNRDGWHVSDAELLYQLMRRVYDARADPTLEPVVEEIVAKLHYYFDKDCYLSTLTRIKYEKKLDVVISRLGKYPAKVPPSRASLPEFTKLNIAWSYLELAQKQPGQQLGTVAPLPTGVKGVLEALFGAGYEYAGAVFQYCSPQRNAGTLNSVRFMIPTATSRDFEGKRVVSLGLNGFDLFRTVSNFGHRPALGVREVKNFYNLNNDVRTNS